MASLGVIAPLAERRQRTASDQRHQSGKRSPGISHGQAPRPPPAPRGSSARGYCLAKDAPAPLSAKALTPRKSASEFGKMGDEVAKKRDDVVRRSRSGGTVTATTLIR